MLTENMTRVCNASTPPSLKSGDKESHLADARFFLLCEEHQQVPTQVATVPQLVRVRFSVVECHGWVAACCVFHAILISS